MSNAGNPDVPPRTPPLSAKKDLLDAIDFELQRAAIAERRAGVNMWGLLAALGAVLWLISGHYHDANAVMIGPLFVFFSLLIDGILFFVVLATLARGDDAFSLSEGRFQPSGGAGSS